MKAVVYDAGVLIAADRSDRRTWDEHEVRLACDVTPLVPSAVVAQVSRSPHQAQLRRFLRGCEVVPLLEDDAHAIGRLLAAAATSDVVDGCVVALAVGRDATIVTSDRDDIEFLAYASGTSVAVVDA